MPLSLVPFFLPTVQHFIVSSQVLTIVTVKTVSECLWCALAVCISLYGCLNARKEKSPVMPTATGGPFFLLLVVTVGHPGSPLLCNLSIGTCVFHSHAHFHKRLNEAEGAGDQKHGCISAWLMPGSCWKIHGSGAQTPDFPTPPSFLRLACLGNKTWKCANNVCMSSFGCRVIICSSWGGATRRVLEGQIVDQESTWSTQVQRMLQDLVFTAGATVSQ